MKKIAPLLFIILFTSCQWDILRQDADDYPFATQTGENVFACYVNGELKIQRSFLYLSAFEQFESLTIGASFEEDEPGLESILIRVNDPVENQRYFFDNDIYLARYYDIQNTIGSRCKWEFEDTYQGSIIFTKIDRSNKIVSGTFDIYTENVDCGNREIRRGVFDLKLR